MDRQIGRLRKITIDKQLEFWWYNKIMKKSTLTIYRNNNNKWIALDKSTEKLLATGGTISEITQKIPKNNANVTVAYVDLSNTK